MSILSLRCHKRKGMINMDNCEICTKEVSFVAKRKIADNKIVCSDCLDKARTLTPMQIMRMKKLTVNQLRESIVDSGFEIEEYTPPTIDELIEQLDSTIKCPKCDSKDLQFMQNNKKAFSVGKAVGGAVLTGGIGTLAGFAGKKGNDQWRCSNCGNIFTTKKQK